MEKRFRDLYMDIAVRTSQMSRAERLKVGCVIVKDGRIISMAWNGTVAGADNTCEEKERMPFDAGGWLDIDTIETQWPYSDDQGRYKLVTKSEVIHAEMNAIAKLARSGDSGYAADLFVTHSPCIECAKLIKQAGISRVYYQIDYRSSTGVDFLRTYGVDVVKVD